MSIEKLVKLVPPPKAPVELGTKKDWARAEKTLGVKLPSDYKEFIDRYGSGEFAGFYIVYNPFSASDASKLLDRFERLGQQYRESHEDDPDNFPLDMFPKTPGMIPWGHDTNGHTYFWLVKDKKKPDEWTVVWDEGDDQGFEEHKWTFSEYLLGVLKGKIDALAGNYPQPESFKFTPLARSAEAAGDDLCTAIRKKDEKRVEEMLDAGTDPNSLEKSGRGALGYAVQFAPKIAQRMLDRGANVDVRDDLDQTSLFMAATMASPESAAMLLKAGADVNAKDIAGRTPLVEAIRAGAASIARTFLEAGTDPNTRDEDGRSPLMEAIGQCDEAMVALLLEFKANASVKDNEGKTALALAREKRQDEIVSLLKAAGAKK